MQATWKGLGGSTPHAYQASKAEQDRLAARLWAGGAGRHLRAFERTGCQRWGTASSYGFTVLETDAICEASISPLSMYLW